MAAPHRGQLPTVISSRAWAWLLTHPLPTPVPSPSPITRRQWYIRKRRGSSTGRSALCCPVTDRSIDAQGTLSDLTSVKAPALGYCTQSQQHHEVGTFMPMAKGSSMSDSTGKTLSNTRCCLSQQGCQRTPRDPLTSTEAGRRICVRSLHLLPRNLDLPPWQHGAAPVSLAEGTFPDCNHR